MALTNLPFLNLSLAFLFPVVKGVGSWLPGVQHLLYAPQGGQTHWASYCYGVWLKHLCLLWKHGMRRMPVTVVELGPGNSIGTGYAALLSGAARYVGIDRVRHADGRTNSAVLRELIQLFQRRAGRPSKGWPDFDDCLDERLFPSHILTPKRLGPALDARRLARLADGQGIDYRLWKEQAPIGSASVDLVFSHSVLSHVDDLDEVHAATARWLKPGGWVSHQVDLSAMGTMPEWNGHLRFEERTWNLVKGRRIFYINRLRASEHLRLLERHGLRIVAAIRGMRTDGLRRQSLAPRFRDLPAEDLGCWGLYVIAQKAPA